MEKASAQKKRLSILKKRRSRSLSPSQSPQIERRTSRRISFSGKHAVREFFIGGENKETIWGASYEESTEQLTVNSDQMSRQQQSIHLNRTKNETIRSEEAMECSSIIASTSSAQLTSASIAVSSTFCRNRTVHGNVSIAVAEKESNFNSNTSNAIETMNISAAASANVRPKIKLFEAMRQKKSSPSTTLHQLTDMNLDVSSNGINRKTTFTTQNMSMLGNTRSPPPPSRPSQVHRMNETNVNNPDMSVIVAQTRTSVICKSPSKNVSSKIHRNQTVNFESDTMDVTRGARDENNLQESWYPLNATSMDQSHMNIRPKPNAVTNPYLKMFLGQTSNNSFIEPIESIETGIAVSTASSSIKSNVTANESLANEIALIPIDHSTAVELFQHPNPTKNETMSETLTPISDRNGTIHDQLSIDNSFDFPLPTTVAQEQNKENIFVVPSKPALNYRNALTLQNNDAAQRVSLSETINTSVFDLHRDNVINSTYLSNNSNVEMTLRRPDELSNASLDVSVAPYNLQLSIATPQLPPRCDQTISNEITKIFDHENKSIDISNQRIAPPMAIPVLKQRRVTCFKTESIDESAVFENMVEINEHTKISTSPTESSPINATVLDGQMNISIMPSIASIGHHRNTAGRKTSVFQNEPISVESTLNTLPASALNSYHHLTMEQTQIASRDTSVIQSSSTNSTSQPAMLPPRLSFDCSRPLDEFCQLTFIDDEDMDLVKSVDSTDGDDNNDCVIVNQSIDADAEPQPTKNTLKISTILSRSNTRANAFETRVENSQISLASPLSLSVDAHNTMKQTSSLQCSSMLDVSRESATTATAALPVIRCNQNGTIREPEPMTIQSNQNDANSIEISYLHHVTIDKQVKDIKLNFSGYEKFKGLATPNDVCNAFFQRCEILKQQIHQMKETAKTKNLPDPQTQNLEAPSLKFLFFNKLAMLDAENAAKFKEECDQKPIGALCPITPALLELIENKCKELKHWHFESLWFYRGRLILRHKILQAYKFILDFDPEQKNVDDHINLYGKLMFTRARTMQCPIWLPRLRPIDRLRLQATIASEPINLLPMCPSSNDLSNFDEIMHTIVRDACNKVTNLMLSVVDANAILHMENDLVYIFYRFDEREHLRFVTCNIKLMDIDRTGPENVQTIPYRALHNDVNALPKGVDFIREFLRNARKYLAEPSEPN